MTVCKVTESLRLALLLVSLTVLKPQDLGAVVAGRFFSSFVLKEAP